MKLVQILGPGCPKCEKLKANAELAAKMVGTEVIVEKVSDIHQIATFGVMTVPALVIDGEVKAVGTVLSPEQIKAMLE